MRFWIALFVFVFYLTESPGLAVLRAEQSQLYLSTNSELPQGLDVQEKDEPLAVYLLTIEPASGDLSLFWSWWGHTALLVRDQEKNLDLVFDYGLFENIGSSFLYHYLKGDPVFLLGIDSLANTLSRYRAQKRTVYAQRLHAKEQNLKVLYQNLIINAQPQNRKYVYHHYYNNCTTKVRDIIDKFLFDNALHEKYSQLKGKESIAKKALAPNLNWPPLFILFSSAVGYSLDTIHNSWQDMFLPIDLMQALDIYGLDAKDSDKKSVDSLGKEVQAQKLSAKPKSKEASVAPRHVLWQAPQLPPEKSFIFSWLFFIVFFLLWLFIFYLYPLFYPKKKLSSFLSVLGWWLCYLPLSLTALFLSYTYFVASSSPFGYQTVGYNFGLHALNPLLFFLLIAWPFCRKNKRAKLWFALHRAFLLFLEVGCVLALFLASYVLPLLIIVLCIQRMLLIQVKRGIL